MASACCRFLSVSWPRTLSIVRAVQPRLPRTHGIFLPIVLVPDPAYPGSAGVGILGAALARLRRVT